MIRALIVLAWAALGVTVFFGERSKRRSARRKAELMAAGRAWARSLDR